MGDALDFGKYAERDFSSKTFEVLPAGVYKVTIDKAEKCVAKTGMEQMRVYATVIEGEHEGKPLADHIALSDAAEWRVVWFIKEALGWSKEELKAMGKIARNSERFNRLFDLAKGRTMSWVVVIDPAYHNNKVTEYVADETSEPVLVDELDGDIPDFLREKKK